MNTTSLQQPIPGEIREWINTAKLGHAPGTAYSSKIKAVEFGMESMYHHLSHELSKLREENKAFREALGKIRDTDLWDEPHSTIPKKGRYANHASKVLDQYPLTDKIDKDNG